VGCEEKTVSERKPETLQITIDELKTLPEEVRVLVDTRGETSFAYGSLPGARTLTGLMEQAQMEQLDRAPLYVLFSMHGRTSLQQAQELRNLGYRAASLQGGYGAWLGQCYATEDKTEEIEKGLRSKRAFHDKLFVPFARAVRDYELLSPNDQVAVCISGGKDSMLMAKLFQELHRHHRFEFGLTFLVMDPGYDPVNRMLIEQNAKMMGVPITVFETGIFDAVYEIPKSPCYLCARMRRGYLYAKAKELGCNKIALGHHYDDVIETILMGMLWSGQTQTMMPKLHSTNFEGMELIRPMYYIREEDIIDWRNRSGLHFIQCACRFTETCSATREDGTSASKRMETKQLIRMLRKSNPGVESNIFNSMKNVNLRTVLAYKKDGEVHSFLDDY